MNLARARRALPAPTARLVGQTCLNGVPSWLYDDGNTLPIVAGGAPDDPPNDEGAGGGGKDDGKTLTQAEANEIARKARAEGERAARRKAYTDLGLDPETAKPEDLTAVRERAKAAKDAEDAALSAAEKAKKDADEAAEAAKRDREAAARERHEGRVERALGAAGLDIADDKLLARAMRNLDLEVGADPDAIKAAVTDLKKDLPTLFGEAGSETPPPSGGDGGNGGRNAQGGGKSKGGVEAKRAEIRKRKLEAAGKA